MCKKGKDKDKDQDKDKSIFRKNAEVFLYPIIILLIVVASVMMAFILRECVRHDIDMTDNSTSVRIQCDSIGPALKKSDLSSSNGIGLSDTLRHHMKELDNSTVDSLLHHKK